MAHWFQKSALAVWGCRIFMRELGISLNPYGVLSRGLLSGKWSMERSTGGSDFRSHSPRFAGENLEKNLKLVENLRKIADEKETTVAKLAIAWVLSRGEDIIPLIGARKRTQLGESLDALNLHLSQEDLERIEQAVPAAEVAGDRYASAEMKMLDSEK